MPGDSLAFDIQRNTLPAMSNSNELNNRLSTAITALWNSVPKGERVVEIVDATASSKGATQLRVFTVRDVGGKTERKTYDFHADGKGGNKLEDRSVLKRPHPLSPSRGDSQG